MNQANGTVQDIYTETRTSRAGKPFNIWKVKLNTGEEFENGFNKPTFNVGDVVSFQWEMKYNKPTIADGSKPAPKAQGNKSYGGGSGAAGKGSYTPKPFPLPKNHGDTSIIRQNALTNARELVCNAAGSDKADIYDLAEQVINIAYMFAEFSSGQREERIAKEMMNQPVGQQPQE